MSIEEKAVLLTVNIHQWTGRKLDRAVTDEIASTAGAQRMSGTTSQDIGAYRKAIVAKDELAEAKKIAGKVRNWTNSETLPWNNAGGRILPSRRIFPYMEKLRDYIIEFDNAVETFLSVYPSLRASAQVRLGRMYNPDDYPTVEEIRSKFGIDFTIDPLPYDFRIQMSEANEAELRERLEEQNKTRINAAMSEAWDRIHKTVSHIAEKLSDDESIFRDSLVANAVELCNVMRDLNITSDPELESSRQELEGIICGVSPQSLRDDPKLRGEIAQKAKAAQQQIEDDILGKFGR